MEKKILVWNFWQQVNDYHLLWSRIPTCEVLISLRHTSDTDSTHELNCSYLCVNGFTSRQQEWRPTGTHVPLLMVTIWNLVKYWTSNVYELLCEFGVWIFHKSCAVSSTAIRWFIFHFLPCMKLISWKWMTDYCFDSPTIKVLPLQSLCVCGTK